MNLSQGSCPSLELLRSCLLGQLSAADMIDVYDHVEECVECQSRLVSLDHSEDEFLAELRSSRGTSAQPALERMTRAAEKLATEPTHLDVQHAATLVGKRIRNYEILEQIGQGGMGAVYRARHVRLGRQFAVKVLAPNRNADQRAIDRFHREIKAIGMLEHPNIVQPVDAGEMDEQPYLAMELVDGENTEAIATRHGPLRVSDACEIGRQTAVGLAYIHDAGFVHRDIKPSNLILSKYGQVKILDLGLALLKHELDPQLTHVAQMLGSVDYMAPEQALDSHSVGPSADIYSLGATLHYLISGKLPSGLPDNASLFDRFKSLGERSVIRLSNCRADVTDELTALVSQMLEIRPEDRPSSAAGIANRLERFTANADLVALSQDQPISRISNDALVETDLGLPTSRQAVTISHSRRPLLALGAFVALLVAFAACLYYAVDPLQIGPVHSSHEDSIAGPGDGSSNEINHGPPVEFPLLQKHDRPISALTFSNTGTLLASADESGMICVRDLPQQRNLTVLYVIDSVVVRLEFSTDDRHLFATDGSGSRTTFRVDDWALITPSEPVNPDGERADRKPDVVFSNRTKMHLFSSLPSGRSLIVLANGKLLVSDATRQEITYSHEVFHEEELPTAIAGYANVVATGSTSGQLFLLRIPLEPDRRSTSAWRDYREFWHSLGTEFEEPLDDSRDFRPGAPAAWPEDRDEQGYLVFRMREAINGGDCTIEYRLRLDDVTKP